MFILSPRIGSAYTGVSLVSFPHFALPFVAVEVAGEFVDSWDDLDENLISYTLSLTGDFLARYPLAPIPEQLYMAADSFIPPIW